MKGPATPSLSIIVIWSGTREANPRDRRSAIALPRFAGVALLVPVRGLTLGVPRSAPVPRGRGFEGLQEHERPGNAEPLDHRNLERDTGVEPATSTLAR